MTEQKKEVSLFANRYFRLVFLSFILLQLGIWVRNMAVLWYVTEKTGDDPVAVSLTIVAEYAPILLFSFIGGTFADRWRPKLTMICCDTLSAVSVFALIVALFYGSWPLIYLVTFVSAMLSQFSQPSAMKLFKQRIPDKQLQQAMGIIQSMVAIFFVGGPALGIFIYQTFGIHTSISVMGTAFLLSALVLIRLPKDVTEANEEKAAMQFWKELNDGIGYVRRSRVLSITAGTFILVGLAVGISQTLGYFIIVDRLNQPKEFLQYMMMINGVFMLVGGAVIASLGKKLLPQTLLAAGLLVNAFCIAGVGVSTNVMITMVLQMFSGMAFPAIHIGVSTIVLRWTESAFVGRVNGVITPMFTGGMVLMSSFAGYLMETFTLVIVYGAAGLIMLLALLLFMPVRKVRPPGELATNDSGIITAEN